MKENDQKLIKHEFLNQNSKKEPIHLKQVPNPRGRDGQQIDSDTEI